MPATLRSDTKTQKVLRSLMEKQQAIAIGERIWELRENSEETNGSIADYCNVRERTVAGWVGGEGISYKNCKRVAQLFRVDVDWLWRGRKGADPEQPFDRMGSNEAAELRDSVAALSGQMERVLEQLATLGTAVAEVQQAQQDQQGRKPPPAPRKSGGSK